MVVCGEFFNHQMGESTSEISKQGYYIKVKKFLLQASAAKLSLKTILSPHFHTV